MQNVNSKNSLLARSNLTPIQAKYIDNTWAHMFRKYVFDKLPMSEVVKLYCEDNGRPTKELRAVTGCIILQHLFDFTDTLTCEQYLYNSLWGEALNLNSLKMDDRRIAPRTLWDHTKKLSTSGLLIKILDAVNQSLANVANASFTRQRLDSVHISGNMAKLNRIQLFSKTTKVFLHNLKKNHRSDFNLIDPSLSKRYLGENKDASDSGYPFFSQPKTGQRDKTLKSMATDIYTLVEMFKDQQHIAVMQSYQLLKRLFSEQCRVVASENNTQDNESPVQVEVKDPKEVPSDSLQNPSDPDASYSGHKGQGYHAQLMESCGTTKDDPDKTISLITVATVEGAHRHDGHSTIPAIEAAAEAGFKPEVVICDTAYGGDSNVD
jgi:hypothetical protein